MRAQTESKEEARYLIAPFTYHLCLKTIQTGDFQAGMSLALIRSNIARNPLWECDRFRDCKPTDGGE